MWLEKLEGRSERRPIWKNSSQFWTRHPPCSALPHLIALPPSGQELSLMDLNVEDILSPLLSLKNFLQRTKGINCKSHFSSTHEGEQEIRKLETRYRMYAHQDCSFQSFLTENNPDVLQSAQLVHFIYI